MSFPGLRQGFVRFGTRAESILKALYYCGDMRGSEIAEEVGCTPAEAATILRRLVGKFVRVVDYDPDDRICRIYRIGPKANRHPTPQRPERLTPVERTKRYRQRKRGKVASVFEFRP